MSTRRTLVFGLFTGSTLGMVGCAATPGTADSDVRTYCINRTRSRRAVCAADALPPIEVEREAKLFQPVADAFTLYVVRGRYLDAIKPVDVLVNGSTSVRTLPRSMVRMRLPAGKHSLSVTWDGTARRHEVLGRLGEVRLVELAGADLPWERSYYWSEANPAATREMALATRLIADL